MKLMNDFLAKAALIILLIDFTMGNGLSTSANFGGDLANFDFFAKIFFILSLLLIITLTIIGLSIGLIIKIIFKESNIGRPGSAVLGIIGAIIGFFIYFSINANANLLTAILFIALCAASAVILANLIRNKVGKIKRG